MKRAMAEGSSAIIDEAAALLGYTKNIIMRTHNYCIPAEQFAVHDVTRLPFPFWLGCGTRD